MIFSIASKATPLPTANPLTWNLEWSNLKKCLGDRAYFFFDRHNKY